MDPNEPTLSQNYSLTKLAIHSSTQISSRTASIIAKLSAQPSEDGKQVIVALTAKAKSINKLVSIVEIAKRELAAAGTGVFQYNALGSEMVQIARESKDRTDAKVKVKEDGAGDDESDDAFETMGGSEFSESKVRAIPVMTTYLSTASVRELKVAYGEQR